MVGDMKSTGQIFVIIKIFSKATII